MCAQGSEFDSAVLRAAEALCEVQCPEAVQGLQTWYKGVTGGRKLSWVKAAVHKAAGRWVHSPNCSYKLCNAGMKLSACCILDGFHTKWFPVGSLNKLPR